MMHCALNDLEQSQVGVLKQKLIFCSFQSMYEWTDTLSDIFGRKSVISFLNGFQKKLVIMFNFSFTLKVLKSKALFTNYFKLIMLV